VEWDNQFSVYSGYSSWKRKINEITLYLYKLRKRKLNINSFLSLLSAFFLLRKPTPEFYYFANNNRNNNKLFSCWPARQICSAQLTYIKRSETFMWIYNAGCRNGGEYNKVPLKKSKWYTVNSFWHTRRFISHTVRNFR
jgi:hypothetical protein